MLMEQLSALIISCDEDERDLIEKMVDSAGNYVNSVTRMKARSLNYAGRTGQELRSAVEQSDRERSNCHNALIAHVDIVNRICGLHGQAPIYTGPSNVRREYGSFAIQLVSELFAVR